VCRAHGTVPDASTAAALPTPDHDVPLDEVEPLTGAGGAALQAEALEALWKREV
jgi:hypothetical protein